LTGWGGGDEGSEDVDSGGHREAMNMRKWTTVPLLTFDAVERKIVVSN